MTRDDKPHGGIDDLDGKQKAFELEDWRCWLPTERCLFRKKLD